MKLTRIHIENYLGIRAVDLPIDRSVVLDGPGRSAALAWLDVLADTGEVDTVLLLGTLKEVPPKLYPSMQGHWIEKGSMQAARQEEEIAA